MTQPTELASIDTSFEGSSLADIEAAGDAWKKQLEYELRTWTGSSMPKAVRDCSGRARTVDARPSWACHTVIAEASRSSLFFTFEFSSSIFEGRHRGHGRARLWSRSTD